MTRTAKDRLADTLLGVWAWVMQAFAFEDGDDAFDDTDETEVL